MKKLLIIVAMALTLVITACNSESTIEASVPQGYTEVTKDIIGGDDVRVIKHDATGCYYTLINGFQSVAITQMFVEDKGADSTIPYCDKK